MGKRTINRERISQKSISFPSRVFDFLDIYPNFKIHKLCQDIVDNQIAEIDASYLNEEDERYEEKI